jgi:type IV pilus assembly protein PilB
MDSRILLMELLAQGLVTAEDVERAISAPSHRGEALERVLVDEGIVEESTLLQLMSRLYDLPLIDLTPDNVDAGLASKLPNHLLQEYAVYPLLPEPGSELLPLATTDPFDVVAEDAIRQLTGREIRLILAPKAQIMNAIHGKLISGEGLRLLVEGVPDLSLFEGLDDILESEGELSESAAPVIKLVNSILRDAIRRAASDIHIEPQEVIFRVRFRIDGVLRTVVEMPKRVEKTCISRLKIMSGIDISETRKAQDGRLVVRTPDGAKINMRVSTIPSYFGEKMVLRLLDQGAVPQDLTKLGLSPSDYRILTSHLSSSSGMVLLTGPTGSGKTSTLYAALRLLNKPDVNILTVEDPIEFQLAGITQVGVNAKAGVTFASALRAFLRQDPDIIMVGEIRDLETAETAIQAAQTGHLVFSTLHTNDAPGTLSRLVLMGAEPHAVADALLCIVAQRLVRRLCAHCKVPSQPKPDQLTLLSLAAEAPKLGQTFEGKGCEQCDDTGYSGRLGLYEILTVTSSIRSQMLIDSSEQELWNVARSEGMITLLEDGLSKVDAGDTSLEEVFRAVTVRRVKGGTAPSAALGPTLPPLPRGDGPPSKTVRQVMSTKLMVVEPGTLLSEVARICTERGVTGCPVVSQRGNLLGVVSVNDLISADFLPERGRTVQTVREVMSSKLITIGPDESVEAAVQLLWQHKVHRLLVLEEKKLIGVVTPFDLMMI